MWNQLHSDHAIDAVYTIYPNAVETQVISVTIHWGPTVMLFCEVASMAQPWRVIENASIMMEHEEIISYEHAERCYLCLC